VIRQIDDRRLVGRGAVVDAERVVVRGGETTAACQTLLSKPSIPPCSAAAITRDYR
jgi:hypothetical protein